MDAIQNNIPLVDRLGFLNIHVVFNKIRLWPYCASPKAHLTFFGTPYCCFTGLTYRRPGRLFKFFIFNSLWLSCLIFPQLEIVITVSMTTKVISMQMHIPSVCTHCALLYDFQPYYVVILSVTLHFQGLRSPLCVHYSTVFRPFCPALINRAYFICLRFFGASSLCIHYLSRATFRVFPDDAK